MRYKIYFGDHPLYLTDKLDHEMNEIMHHDDGVYMDELSPSGIKSMIHEMKTIPPSCRSILSCQTWKLCEKLSGKILS
jgi:hypothetical protein